MTQHQLPSLDFLLRPGLIGSVDEEIVSRDGSDSYSVRAPVVQQRRRLASMRLPAFSPDPQSDVP
jgi:hypothetical protein